MKFNPKHSRDKHRRLAKNSSINSAIQRALFEMYPKDANVAGELIYNPNLDPVLFDPLFAQFKEMFLADMKSGYVLKYNHPATQKRLELVMLLA